MFKRSTIPAALRQSALAGQIPASELELLDRRGTVLSINNREPVIRQHSIGREWILVLEGELEVHKNSERVGSLENGDFAGELALPTANPRNATVTTAVDQSFLYVYTRREFSSLLDEAPKLAEIVLSTAADRLSPDTR